MDDEQSIEITGLPEGHPPLMVFVEKRLRPQEYEQLRVYIHDTVSHSLRERRVLIFEPGIDVYQMIDGRWQPIHPDA